MCVHESVLTVSKLYHAYLTASAVQTPADFLSAFKANTAALKVTSTTR